VLDIERRELRRGAQPVALEPQVFDLVVYLVRNRGRVVTKDDLIQGVWGGRIVSDSALTTPLNAVRKAVDDSGAAQRVIRTVPRRGVRFIGEVSEDGEPAAPVGLAPAGAEPPNAPRLSIVVLPFANLSNDPEQQYFADGITGGLTTDLSRILDMLVIARYTAFTYRGKAIDTKRIGRELGVRYTLEGEVQRSGNRVRVTAQLIDAEPTRICGPSGSTATPAICSPCRTRSRTGSRLRSTSSWSTPQPPARSSVRTPAITFCGVAPHG
jgi:TolB-like protein